jgi:hypothetical protein
MAAYASVGWKATMAARATAESRVTLAEVVVVSGVFILSSVVRWDQGRMRGKDYVHMSWALLAFDDACSAVISARPAWLFFWQAVV